MNFEKISKKQYLKDQVNSYIDYNDIIIPHRATINSAGYDIFSVSDFTLGAGETIRLPTGIRVNLDPDKFLMIVPRSGLGFKYRLQLDNSVGIVDADYYDSDNEGHIWVKLTNDSRENKALSVKQGDAIAQGIILQYFKCDSDNVTIKRNGGFGSTSKGDK